jgi:hypothetical protein
VHYFQKKQAFLLPTIDATISQLMLLGLFTCILFALRQVKPPRCSVLRQCSCVA